MLFLLFHPFRRGVWARLLLIAWISGFMPSGFGLSYGGNWNLNNLALGNGAESADDAQIENPQENPDLSADSEVAEAAPDGASADALAEAESEVVEEPFTYERLSEYRVKALGWLGRHKRPVLGVLLLLTLVSVFWRWLMSRFSFIFVDVLLGPAVRIREPFKRLKAPGNSLFLWWLIVDFSAVCLAVLGAWIVYARLDAALSQNPLMPLGEVLSGNIGVLLSIFLTFLFYFGAFLVLVWLVEVWTHHLVVPVMYQGRCKVREAWGRVLGFLTADKWEAVKYLFWVFAMNIVVGFVQVFVIVAGVFILALTGGLLAVLGLLLVKLIPAIKLIAAICGVVLSVLGALAAAVLVLGVRVPIAVFVRAFSLHYVSSVAAGMGLPAQGEDPPVAPSPA